MKVTKEQLHEDLRPFYLKANAIKPVFQYKWLTKSLNAVLNRVLKGAGIKGLKSDEISIPSSDGAHQIRTRIYRPLESEGELPVVVYFHGGGYFAGIPEQFHVYIEGFIKTKPCIVVAPDYRKSYTAPYPAGFNDCYDTLLWVKNNTQKLGASRHGIITAGHSAGGGLTAAVTLKARDTGDVPIAFQMPFYPMIDDQQPADASRYIKAPVWDSHTNKAGWGAYLSELHKTKQAIPAYAVPAKNSDYSGFPPTITLVGTLDPFYQETCRYVEALKNAGVDVAFETYEGAFHAFEVIAAQTNISHQVFDYTFSQFAKFYDRYAIREL